jgi:hypothetical protein
MNRTARRETYCRQVVKKLITSFHSKRFWSSGLLIHRQNSYEPRSKRCTGRREKHSREPVNNIKKKLSMLHKTEFNVTQS